MGRFSFPYGGRQLIPGTLRLNLDWGDPQRVLGLWLDLVPVKKAETRLVSVKPKASFVAWFAQVLGFQSLHTRSVQIIPSRFLDLWTDRDPDPKEGKVSAGLPQTAADWFEAKPCRLLVPAVAL
jgi:hypothetical protein